MSSVGPKIYRNCPGLVVLNHAAYGVCRNLQNSQCKVRFVVLVLSKQADQQESAAITALA